MIKLLSKAILADSVGQVLGAFERLLFIYVLTDFLGVQGYGSFVTILAYITFVNLVDLGYGQQLVNSLTIIYARNKRRYFLKVFNTAFLMISIWVWIVFFAITITVSIINETILNVSITPERSISLSFIVISLSLKFLISIPGGLILSLYRIRGENYKSVILKDVIILFSIVNIYITVSVFKILELYLALEVIFSAMIFCIIRIRLKKYYLQTSKKSLIGSFRSAKLEFANAIAFFKVGISQNINTSGLILLISQIADSGSVAIISTTRTVISLIWPLIGVISHAIWPELTRSYAIGKEKRVIFLLEVNSLSALLIIALVSNGLNLFYNEIGLLWEPFLTLVDSDLLFFLFVTYSPLIICNTYSNFLMAISRHLIWSNILIISNMISLLIIYILSVLFSLNFSIFVSLAIYSLILIAFQSRNTYYVLKSNYPKIVILDAVVSVIVTIIAFKQSNIEVFITPVVLCYLVLRLVRAVKNYA